MDFIFDLLLEIIVEPIVECYVFAMALFSKDSKKINEETAKYIVVFESITLMIMFVAGGVMLLETNGDSIVGKTVFILSIAVSLFQISIGIILKIVKKK